MRGILLSVTALIEGIDLLPYVPVPVDELAEIGSDIGGRFVNVERGDSAVTLFLRLREKKAKRSRSGLCGGLETAGEDGIAPGDRVD